MSETHTNPENQNILEAIKILPNLGKLRYPAFPLSKIANYENGFVSQDGDTFTICYQIPNQPKSTQEATISKSDVMSRPEFDSLREMFCQENGAISPQLLEYRNQYNNSPDNNI